MLLPWWLMIIGEYTIQYFGIVILNCGKIVLNAQVYCNGRWFLVYDQSDLRNKWRFAKMEVFPNHRKIDHFSIADPPF